MRKLMLAAIVVCLAGAIGATGCNKGKTGESSKPAQSPKDGGTGGDAKKFNLATDVKDGTQITQGKTQDVDITVKRGSDMKEDVTVTTKLEGKTKDITIKPESYTYKGSDTSHKFTISVGENVPADTEFSVKWTGDAADQKGSHVELNFKVKAAK